MSQLDLKISSYINAPNGLKSEIAGQVWLRDQIFQFISSDNLGDFYGQGFRAFSMKNGETYLLQFVPKKDQKDTLLLTNGTAESKEDILSKVYFGQLSKNIDAEKNISWIRIWVTSWTQQY